MAGTGLNTVKVDVVGEFLKLKTELRQLQSDLQKNGVEVPVEGKFDEFKKEFRAMKAEVEKEPIYADVRINETKFRKELAKIDSAIKDMQKRLAQTPLELKTTLDKNFLSGIEDQLNNLLTSVNDVSKALRTSGQLEIISERQIQRLDEAEKSLTGVLNANKSAIKASDTDAFYNKAVKQFKNLAKYRENFFGGGAEIKEVLNDTGVMGLNNALRLMLKDLFEAEDAAKELNKTIQFGEGKDEIISYREALSLIVNDLDAYIDKEKALQGTIFTSGMFKNIKQMIDASEELERTQKEMASVKIKEMFKQDQVNKIEGITKAFANLDDLVGKLSNSLQAVSTASSGTGGTPFQFDKEQLEAITSTFSELNNVLKELSDTLKNGINLGQFAEQVKKVSNATKDIKDASKQTSSKSSTKAQKDTDDAQLRRLAEIEKRKKQIRKLEEEIFEQERKLNQMVNDKADSNIIAQQKQVIKEKKDARHVAYNYVRRGLGGSESKDYKNFVNEIKQANAEKEREIQISKEAARAAKAEATAKRQAAQTQKELEKANAPLGKKDEVKLQKLVNNINEFKEKLDNIKNNTAFDNIRNDVDGLDKSIEELINDLGKVSTKSGLEDVTTRFGKIKESAKGVQGSYALEGDIRKVIDNDLSKYTNADKYTSDFVQRVKGVISSLEKELADSAGDVDKLGEAFKEASQYAELFGKESEQASKGNASTIEKLRIKIAKFLSENSKLGHSLRNELGNLRIRLEGAEVTDEQLKEIISDFNRIQAEAYETGQVGKSAFDTLRGRIQQMSTNFIAMYFSLYDILRYSKELFNATKEFDTALTEMRKVSDETITTLKNFQAESFGTADAVGSTALALQQSTADWMRLGESIEEAKKSAATTTVLLNVSEFENVDEATEALVSASQAYNDLEKLDIVDKLNIIGNNFSISTDQLAQGLQNAAAVLKTQGNDIEEALALLTAGNSITQDISKTSAILYWLECIEIYIHSTHLIALIA